MDAKLKDGGELLDQLAFALRGVRNARDEFDSEAGFCTDETCRAFAEKAIEFLSSRLVPAQAPAGDVSREEIADLLISFIGNDLFGVKRYAAADAVLARLAAKPAEDGVREALVDLQTHRESWRSALEKAQDIVNDDTHAYWTHELKAFDRVFSALSNSGEAS